MIGSSDSSAGLVAAEASTSFRFPLAALTTLFFMWGFLTALNDILIPHLKNVFELSYTQAMLIQFCFFGAYFAVSIPAGGLVAKLGYQRGLVLGLLVAGVGCFLFYPAASLRMYSLFLGALFILATGITLLQVSANPYVTILGPAATASSRLNMTQAFNSLGTTLAPFFGAFLILAVTPDLIDSSAVAASDAVVAARSEADTVKLPYLLLGSTLLVMAVTMALLRLPVIAQKLQAGQQNAPSAGSILGYRHLLLGALAIFIYVGAEVAIGSLLVSFIVEHGVVGINEQQAAHYVAYYWGGALVGRFIGAWLMTRIAPGKLLAFNSSLASLLVLLAVVSGGKLAMIALLSVGLCNSIMFPTIFSLAIKDLGPQTSKGAGLVCAAIVGGALIPLLQGTLADTLGLQLSFLLPACCYLYIIYYGLAGSRVISPTPP
ncbi:sugar MFS transporter [Halioxenophilus sp. WMMB6]|uniref:sugar MFS transporter n=1 Tax=Halioxenophilus sp. WMMB6 TaxID=3073815 RepID=UPI00295E781D|nr:sugar MFS transporter [Halioxenophilus sp. WMMB6]